MKTKFCKWGIKLVGFPSKKHGKNHKVLLRKPKQIRVKLHGNKWKPLLASWKRSELDVKTKRKTRSSLWILPNTGYYGGCIESFPLWVRLPYLNSASELQKLLEVMGFVIIKSTSTFTTFYSRCNVTVWCFINIVSDIAFIQNI